MNAIPKWLRQTRTIIDMINDSKPEDIKPSNPNANGGRGLIVKVFTPAGNKEDWEDHYWDQTSWEGLQDAKFQFNWPVGELIFENAEILTHEAANEAPRAPRLEEGWVELPETYGEIATR
jgi:hypothetical protein